MSRPKRIVKRKYLLSAVVSDNCEKNDSLPEGSRGERKGLVYFSCLVLGVLAASPMMACNLADSLDVHQDGAANQEEVEEFEEHEEYGEQGEKPKELSGNQLDQGLLFLCMDDTIGYTEGRFRRIGRTEWTRNTGHSSGSAASRNPFDAAPTHFYSTYSEGETIDESILDIYLGTVGSGAHGWATRNRHRRGALASNVHEASIGCMYSQNPPDEDCIENFTRYFLERGVLFRPPREEEHQALIEFATNVLEGEGEGEGVREHSMSRIFSAAWMTSGALFREELGEGPSDDFGRRRLGDWELANAIAYALDGRAAGAPGVYARFGLAWSAEYEGHLPGLRQAALDGTISQPETIASLVREYFGGLDEERKDLNLDVQDSRRITRRGEYWLANGLREFFREWLGYEAHINIFKDNPGETSAFGREVANDYANLISGYYGHESRLVEQMDDMIARVVVRDTSVFEELLTTRTFYVPATAEFENSNTRNNTLRTSYIYNVTDPVESTREDRWRELPETERAGVLTHPAFLASHAGAFENDPNIVDRGKWIREQLLCQDVPDFPIEVEAAFDPETRDQSARQRMFEQVDTLPNCAGCHLEMNPLGYPFEIYNHAGFLRVEDHGSEPDGSSILRRMPDPNLNGPVRDAVELSEKLADSDYARQCFLRQVFRYFMGREEVLRDACTLEEMNQAYIESDGSLVEVLIALFQSESFQYRVFESQTEVNQ